MTYIDTPNSCESEAKLLEIREISDIPSVFDLRNRQGYQMSLNMLLDRFKHKDLYYTDAMFHSIINLIVHGADVYSVIDSLFDTILNQHKNIFDNAMNRDVKYIYSPRV